MNPYSLYKLKSDTTGRIVEESTGGEINSYSYAKNKTRKIWSL